MASKRIRNEASIQFETGRQIEFETGHQIESKTDIRPDAPPSLNLRFLRRAPPRKFLFFAAAAAAPWVLVGPCRWAPAAAAAAAAAKTGEKAKFEKDGRMIMSVDTMLRLQNALKKVVDEMAEKGIIVPKDKKKN